MAPITASRFAISTINGTAGAPAEEFDFTANAFQYKNDHAIDIRGYPSLAATISNNVFAHGDLSDAIRQRLESRPVGGVLVTAEANTTGVNTSGQYGVCDFDGDGLDDLFLATGASWWYASSAGKCIGPSSIRILSACGKSRSAISMAITSAMSSPCTATAGKYVSSRGTDIWRSLGLIGVPFSELRWAISTAMV